MKTFDARSRFESAARSTELQLVLNASPCGLKRRTTPVPSSVLGFLFSVFCLLSFSPNAYAQWQAVTYKLSAGYNSIYLHGDPDIGLIPSIAANRPEILEIWQWNPKQGEVQIGSSALLPRAPDWFVWKRGETTQTLNTMLGQTAYVVRCATGTLNAELTILQRTQPPVSRWVRNGANFMGFPTRLGTDGNSPSFSSYFNVFPTALAGSIFKYVGGDLGAGNPVPLFIAPSGNPERVDRNRAYWFESPVVSDFFAPVEVEVMPASTRGLEFQRIGSRITVRVRNRTAAVVTVKIAPESSAPTPAGVQPLPVLLRRIVDPGQTTVAVTEDVAVPPKSYVDLAYTVDRSLMNGPAGSIYASFLRFTDTGNLVDIYVPASADVQSLEGLWVGTVRVSAVESRVPGATGVVPAHDAFPLRVILHVSESGGVQTVRLLPQVFLGDLAADGVTGLCTYEAALKADKKSGARRLSAAHLPAPRTVQDTVGYTASGTGIFAKSGTVPFTVRVEFNAPTNPFVHLYHPDHDNKDAAPNFASLPNGVESATLVRTCTFTFPATAPAGVLGWGATVLTGNYTETIRGTGSGASAVAGLVRTKRATDGTATDPGLTVSGTFQLRRISSLSAITLPPLP